MKFTAYGHPNIRSTHKNTLEFTKDLHLTVKGDCIIGVKADFALEKIKPLLKKNKIKIIVKVEDQTVICNANINKDFCSEHEIVIRRSNFLSDRTLGIKADKVATDFLHIINKLQNPNQKILVEII
ncbi:MAG: hypothetical protein MAG795_01193 [Candidatus Woesearchaeota archaeon]|nr:hypothetical protein [Candidatus Woesearchaeota archaeon]